MRLFSLQRNEDESGVSGTGKVAQGVEFDNGTVALTWLSQNTNVDASSVAVYDSVDDVREIHGHNGKTEVVFHD